jgi:argininosuccinate synthase
VAQEKIALAYSGGLDTSVIVHWLQERYGAEVVTVTGDLGQKKELVGVEEKARRLGATAVHMLDLRSEFVDEYVFPALRAGALYEGVYPLATALGRPLLAKALVQVARREGCTAIAHGCTGKGNDQVRFEAAAAALAPDLKVFAPVREWEFRSREEEIAYCEQHGIPVAATKASPYSIDENLWGTSIECGVLEDPRVEAPEDAFQRTVSPQQAPDEPAYVTIEFVAGTPVALNGVTLSGVELIDRLNEIGGAHAIGRIDLVENRLVGIKSREIYEAPGATILHRAHRELERLTLDRDTAHYKAKLSHDYADLIYNGLWFSPLRLALDAFVSQTQKGVDGMVTLKLYKGVLDIVSRSSANSLYDPSLATYTIEDAFDHTASAGFIKIFSLPLKTYCRVNGAEVSLEEIES